jgi:hypothetical protein
LMAAIKSVHKINGVFSSGRLICKLHSKSDSNRSIRELLELARPFYNSYGNVNSEPRKIYWFICKNSAVSRDFVLGRVKYQEV